MPRPRDLHKRIEAERNAEQARLRENEERRRATEKAKAEKASGKLSKGQIVEDKALIDALNHAAGVDVSVNRVESHHAKISGRDYEFRSIVPLTPGTIEVIAKEMNHGAVVSESTFEFNEKWRLVNHRTSSPLGGRG